MRIEKSLDSLREWRWRVVAANGKILADSGEGYKSETDCNHALSLLRSGFATAPVIKPSATVRGSWIADPAFLGLAGLLAQNVRRTS